MVKSIYDIKECPDCASMDLVHNERKQQVVCKTCSLIYEPLIPSDEQSYLRTASSEASTTKPKTTKAVKPRTKSRK